MRRSKPWHEGIDVSDLTSRRYWVIAGIVLLAFLLRLHVALGSTYHWDEEREWIPFAQSISIQPGEVNLPVRSLAHPILPAYLIKLGSVIGGENALGFRLMPLLAGTATVFVVALVALRWFGFWAAFWAASLLAFNEYHIYVSTLAIDKSFQLFFAAMAVAAFVWFMKTDETRGLYLAGAAAGVSFLCKETAVLLLPGFLFALLLSRQQRSWLLRPAPYLAALVFFAVILPDVAVNLFMAEETVVSYADHLERAAGVGLERHHLLFFLRDAIGAIYSLTGQQLRDLAPEYASMNSLTGAILLSMVGWTTVQLALRRSGRHDSVEVYLATAFWVVFGFFLFVRVNTEAEIGQLRYVAWFWSDITLIPATLIAGARLATLPGRWRAPAYAITGAAVIYAIGAAVFTRVGTLRGPMVAFNPESIRPADGRLVRVEAAFNYCVLCEKEYSAELLDIRLRQPDGEHISVLGTDAARVAEGSADGTQLILRARRAIPGETVDERGSDVMWYEISYALTDSRGRVQVVEDRVFSPVSFSGFPPRFWTREEYRIVW